MVWFVTIRDREKSTRVLNFQEMNPARRVWISSQQIQGRLHKNVRATRDGTLLYVKFY